MSGDAKLQPYLSTESTRPQYPSVPWRKLPGWVWKPCVATSVGDYCLNRRAQRAGSAATARPSWHACASSATPSLFGFTLAEVAELLVLDEGSDCDLASPKLAAVRQRLTHLRRIERVLSEQVRACAASGGRQRCPLIDTLAHNEPRDNHQTTAR